MYKLAVGLLAGALIFAPSGSSARDFSNKVIEEHCFSISQKKSIAMREITMKPADFVRKDSNIEAAINGVYFGKDNRPEGIAYLTRNHHFATRKPEHVRGYFTIDRNGSSVDVSESLRGNFSDYWLVIGTHPILVADGKVNSQAREERYNKRRPAPRSAIGTKGGKNVCFAVSEDDISMANWASLLQQSGYSGAINLDGGPFSQLAVRDRKSVRVEGKGNQPTRLVIFSYRR